MNRLVAGKYHLKQQNNIGRGGNGDVYKWKEFAIKVIKFDPKMTEQQYILAVSELKNQAQFLKQFNHKNVVKLIDFIEEDGQFYLIMERCQKTLMEAANVEVGQNGQKLKKFSEAEALLIFQQILAGYNYLIMNKVVHRDIKPENCLISNGVVKIADFGFSKQIDSFEQQNMKSLIGTWPYSSPQILRGQPYTSKSDIWSLGILLYEMIAGRRPFYSSNSAHAVLAQIEKQKVPSFNNMKIGENTKKLILSMLKLKQSERISWEQLFKNFNICYCPSPKKSKPQLKQQSQKSVAKKVNNAQVPTKKEYKMQALVKSILSTAINCNKEDYQPPKIPKKSKSKHKDKKTIQKTKIAQKQAKQQKISICNESQLSIKCNKRQSAFEIFDPGVIKQLQKLNSSKNIVHFDITQPKQPKDQQIQSLKQTIVNLKQHKQKIANKNKYIQQNTENFKEIFEAHTQAIFGAQKSNSLKNKQYATMNSDQRAIFQETLTFFNNKFKQMIRVVYSCNSSRS